MGGWFVDIFVEFVARVLIRGVQLLRSHSWPVAPATVLSTECHPATYGCTVATVYYEYVVGDEKYGT